MTDISREAALTAALRDTLDFFERHSNRYDEVNGKHPQLIVEEARSALNLPLDAAEGRVTVKPLAWNEDPDNDGDSCFWRATAGDYIYEVGAELSYWWQLDGDISTCAIGGFKTPELAKAAAQADYDARILSAITPTAPSDNIAEAADIDVFGARRVIDAYDAANPFRTADMHPATCHCHRCAIDWMRALAGKGE